MCILVIIQGGSIHLSNNVSQWFDMPFYYIPNSYVPLDQWLDFVLHTFDLSDSMTETNCFSYCHLKIHFSYLMGKTCLMSSFKYNLLSNMTYSFFPMNFIIFIFKVAKYSIWCFSLVFK